MRLLPFLLLLGCSSPPALPSILPPTWAGAEAPELWARGDAVATLDVMARHNLRAVRLIIRESFGAFKDVESPLGVWHDEILQRVDTVLRAAADRGIRVIVSLHDGRNRRDDYARTFPSFYTDAAARAAYRRRTKHILEFRDWRALAHVTWEVQAHGDWRAAMDWTEDMADYVKRIAPAARVAASIDLVTLGGLAADQITAAPSVDVWTYALPTQEPLDAAAAILSKKLKPAKKQWILVGVGGSRGDPEALRMTLEKAIAVARRFEVPWLFDSLGHDQHAASTEHWPGDVIFDSVVSPSARP